MIKFCIPLAQRTDPALYQDKNLTGENPTRPRVSPLRRFFHWVNPLTAWRQIRHVPL